MRHVAVASHTQRPLRPERKDDLICHEQRGLGTACSAGMKPASWWMPSAQSIGVAKLSCSEMKSSLKLCRRGDDKEYGVNDAEELRGACTVDGRADVET